MRFVLTRDVDDFAARAEDFLAARIERNVLATLLVHARAGSFAASARLFAYATGPGGEICAAAMRFPPWPLLTTELAEAPAATELAEAPAATELAEAPAATELVDAWLAADPTLPGVSAQRPTARAIARAWAERTGGETRTRMDEAMHVLTEVVDPGQPAPGHLRPAAATERDLLIAWERDFVREADVSGGDQAARTIDARLRRGAQLVWDDGTGAPVSTLAVSPRIAGVVRIGPVYTPPAQRERGYASSAVAAAARRALADDGVTRCMLFTDKANPTSNKIYAAVGFRPIGDWEEHIFSPRTADVRPCRPPAAR